MGWLHRLARRVWAWLLLQQPQFDHLRDYWDELYRQWNRHLFETSSPAIAAFVVWWIVGAPPVSVVVFVVVWVFLLAGYYRWREKHIQLVPQFKLTECRVFSPTHMDTSVNSLWLQVLPQCITQVRANKVKGYLLRVMSWSNAGWQPTEFDQPLDLKWSLYDTRPRGLELGINQWLNVCWINNVEPTIHLETLPVPAAQSTLFQLNSSYRFDVRVSARNCPARDISLVVRLGATWDSLTAEAAL